MAPAPCWPTKASGPDSGKVLPILIVVSVKPWPFAVTAFFGIAAPGSPGVGTAPPLGAPGAGAGAADDCAGALSFLAFGPAAADDGLAADSPAFGAGAAAAAPFTASSIVVALPSGVATG